MKINVGDLKYPLRVSNLLTEELEIGSTFNTSNCTDSFEINFLEHAYLNTTSRQAVAGIYDNENNGVQTYCKLCFLGGSFVINNHVVVLIET